MTTPKENGIPDITDEILGQKQPSPPKTPELPSARKSDDLLLRALKLKK